jgi:uncharacterized protein (DUF58 family)
MQETKQIIKQVKKIEISTRHLVEGLITGNYHSIFKGQGIEFSEIRDYRPGDDIRAIDWKVTARFNHPYIKEFIEERDLLVYFAFDVSASGAFGSDVSKRQKSIELVASLMFASMRNNDNVGLFLFTDSVERFIPPRKGKKHILKLISTLVSHEPESGRTDINNSLQFISKVIKKRSILFIISDFYSAEFTSPLKILRNKHDIIAINVCDVREAAIPDIGLIELEDEETGEQVLVDTSDGQFREGFSKLMNEHRKKLETMFRKMKIDMLTIRTDQPYEIPLKRFFKLRKVKVVR